MASKEHCDRCDAVIGFGNGNYADDTAKIPAAFLTARRDLRRSVEPVSMIVSFTHLHEGSNRRIVLCNRCFRAAIKAFSALAVDLPNKPASKVSRRTKKATAAKRSGRRGA